MYSSSIGNGSRRRAAPRFAEPDLEPDTGAIVPRQRELGDSAYRGDDSRGRLTPVTDIDVERAPIGRPKAYSQVMAFDQRQQSDSAFDHDIEAFIAAPHRNGPSTSPSTQAAADHSK